MFHRLQILQIAGLAIAAALAVTAPSGFAQDQAVNSKLVVPGQLTIATTGNAPPMTLTRPDGSLGGFDVALCSLIAEKLHLKVKFDRVSFASALPGLQAGRFDMVCSSTGRTPQRLASPDIYMSDPTVKNFTTLVVRSGDKRFGTVDVAKGKRIGAVRGAQEGNVLVRTYFQNDVQIVEYPGISEGVLDLKNERIDAFAANALVASYFAKGDDALRVVTPGFAIEGTSPYEHGLVVRRAEPELLAAVNKLIAEMKADGTFAKLEKEWLGMTSK